MPHLLLLGDSVFDNASYVPGGGEVLAQLRAVAPEWSHTLRAVDGAVLAAVPAQLQRMPADTTHLLVSAGGNDALGYSGVLWERLGSMAEALERLAEIRTRFEASYRSMLRAVLAPGLPVAVCTIYDPRYADPLQQRLATTALTTLNDAILRLAFEHDLPVIDLRLVCSEPSDYANAIEPSASGGHKIALAIRRLVTGHDFRKPSTIYR